MKVRKRRILLLRKDSSFYAVLYYIILYYTILYCTVLYYIILSFAVQGETGVADSPYFFFFSVL